MTQEIFTQNKNNLIAQINHWVSLSEVNEQYKHALAKLLPILNEYSYENRLKLKGTLSHTIIDSLELDYAMGEKFLEFDKNIG